MGDFEMVPSGEQGTGAGSWVCHSQAALITLPLQPCQHHSLFLSSWLEFFMGLGFLLEVPCLLLSAPITFNEEPCYSTAPHRELRAGSAQTWRSG